MYSIAFFERVREKLCIYQLIKLNGKFSLKKPLTYTLRHYGPRSVSMKRLVCILLIVTILLNGIFLGQKTHAQIPSNVTITSNMEWTIAESPIIFNGTVMVNSNVTLTIDPGVTVNLETYGLTIYGTLTAQGNVNNQITFTSAAINETEQTGSQIIQVLPSDPIYFGQESTSWNAATNSGSIIQNAVLNGVSVNLDGSSPEIDSCVFNYATPFEPTLSIGAGSPQISNNIINYNIQNYGYSANILSVYDGTPLITNNQFEGSFSGTTNTGIEVNLGAPTITGNTFAAQYCNNSDAIRVTSGTPQISNNQFEGNGYLTGIYDSSNSAFTIFNNMFTNCFTGISAQAPSNLIVQGNTFSKGFDGIDIFTGASLAITDNLIDSNSRYGINGGGTIGSNTITNNQIGIHNPSTGIISNNNIVGNTENSITATTANIDAQNNWWGIADTATINRTIYDTKIDPHLGTVLFVPFLTQPNLSAPAIPSGTPTITPVPKTQAQTPQPTAEPIFTPTSTPDQYSQTFAYQVGDIINLNLITTATAVVLVVAWVIVILGYATKSVISKNKARK
jgi:hypothetical protein